MEILSSNKAKNLVCDDEKGVGWLRIKVVFEGAEIIRL